MKEEGSIRPVMRGCDVNGGAGSSSTAAVVAQRRTVAVAYNWWCSSGVCLLLSDSGSQSTGHVRCPLGPAR